MTPSETLINDLNDLQVRFKDAIDKLIARDSAVSNMELAQIISELDFFKELQDLGLTDKLDTFFNSYDNQIKDLLVLADTRGVRNALSVNSNVLEIIQGYDAEILLGKAKDFALTFKRQLLQGMVTGKSIVDIRKDLEGTNLTTPQMNTAIETGLNDFGRTSTALAYSDDKEQRFLYYGSTIPTSSKQCTWLIMNQNLEGYTKEEINKGIVTPFGIINWSGRIPNYNCDETWIPLTKQTLKMVKALQESSTALAAKILEGK